MLSEVVKHLCFAGRNMWCVQQSNNTANVCFGTPLHFICMNNQKGRLNDEGEWNIWHVVSYFWTLQSCVSLCSFGVLAITRVSLRTD